MKSPILIAVALASTSVGATAFAAPTTLACVDPANASNSALSMFLSVDYDANTVEIARLDDLVPIVDMNGVSREPAQISATLISWRQQHRPQGQLVTVAYALNRLTGRFSYQSDNGPGYALQCAVSAAPKPKF